MVRIKHTADENNGISANKPYAGGFTVRNSGPGTHYVYPNGDEVSSFEIVYICRRWSGEVKAVDGEMEKLRFFSCDEIDLDDIHPPIRRVVEEYIEKHR